MLGMVLLGVYCASACSLYQSVGHCLTFSWRRPICSANQWTGFYMITAATHERVKSPGLWDKLDLDSILGKSDQLFKITSKFRSLGMEDLPQEFSIKSCSINIKLLKNNTGEITAGTYLLSIVEIRNSVRQNDAGPLLFVKDYVLGLFCGNDSTIYIYLILIVEISMATCQVLVQQFF